MDLDSHVLTVGIVFSGSHYEALSIVAIESFLKNNQNFKKCCYVSDVKSVSFEKTVKLIIPGIDIIWVEPKIDFSLYSFPKWKGNYITYWKFELLDFVSDNDVLVYIDCDTYTRKSFPIKETLRLLKDEKNPFAATATIRPVYERWTTLRLKSPFHYINAGFFIYIASIDDSRSADIYLEISRMGVLDPCNLYWADQDILNYRFRNNTSLLPENYNVTMGMLQTWSHGRTRLNDLYSLSFLQDPIMIHFTGNALLSYPPNRFSVEYRRHLNNIRKFIKEEDLIEVSSLELLSKELLKPYFSIRNILTVIFGRFYIYQVRLFSIKDIVRLIFLRK
ncbi:hypothetical protein HOL24_04425 [bacterium]|jgi:lipopolysaccharide biosynthesis glycosyltransferase|nr:hypothetical protein [bacterium]